MAADEFAPTIAPGRITRPWEPAVHRSAMGDGYTVSQVAGLNPARRTATIEWPVLTVAQAASIEADLEALIGDYFLYTLPNDDQRTWSLVRVSPVSGEPGPLHVSMSAELREEFVP